jgi:hypothetical protein
MSHLTPGCDDDDDMEPMAEVYSLRGTRQLEEGGGKSGGKGGILNPKP